MQTAHRNGLRLLKLVNTLLEFARIEAGRARASYRPTALPALTAELASTFHSAVERAGLRFEVRCEPPRGGLGRPRHVGEDRPEPGEQRLQVHLRGRDHGRAAPVGRWPRGRAHIGIPAEDRPRLFERFHRVEGSRGRTHEGTGIGLALVQELARLHGGGVSVESEPGRGSRFSVRIPLGRAHLPEDQLESAPAEPTATRAEAYVEEALR